MQYVVLIENALVSLVHCDLQTLKRLEKYGMRGNKMDEKAIRTVLETLATVISDLQFTIRTKDYEIGELKKEIEELKGGKENV